MHLKLAQDILSLAEVHRDCVLSRNNSSLSG